MQTSESEKKICQVHRLEIVAVDLKQQTRPEDKYLCTRCLTDKIDKENMALLTEANQMIQSMKTQSLRQSKEENTLRLTNLKQLQSSIKTFKNYIKTELGKLILLVDQQIEQIQTDIESKETKIEIKNFDDEIQILSENYIGNFNYNIPQEKNCKQKDIELIQLIQESLQNQSKSQYFSEIIKSIDEIKQANPIIQQANINKMPVKEFDQHKTPCLNQTCNKHNKEIIMFNLNESDFSKLACVECIEENPIQYISLKAANKRWNAFIGQQEDLIGQHNFSRENTFNMVIKEVKQLKDFYNDSLSEMLISIDEQLTKNNQDLSDIINLENKSIFELDEKSIEKIIHFLSFKDKNKRLIELQEKQDRLDYLFYQNVKSKLDSLIKHDLLCKQQLIKILQEQNDIQEIRRNAQPDIKASPEVHEFISKCQLQEQYLTIFNESIDLQIELQKEAKTLYQNGELVQIIENQDNNEDTANYSQLQQQYKQFEINSEKMRKLIMAEENEEQLIKISKQKEELLVKIEEEKLELQQIQQKIIGLEENFQTQISNMNQKITQQQQEFTQQFEEENISNNQLKLDLQKLSNLSEQKVKELTIKYDELDKKTNEIQQDVQTVKKSTVTKDEFKSLKQSMDSQVLKVTKSVELLPETIEQKATEQNRQSQKLKEELILKLDGEKNELNRQSQKLKEELISKIDDEKTATTQILKSYDEKVDQIVSENTIIKNSIDEEKKWINNINSEVKLHQSILEINLQYVNYYNYLYNKKEKNELLQQYIQSHCLPLYLEKLFFFLIFKQICLKVLINFLIFIITLKSVVGLNLWKMYLFGNIAISYL